MKTRMLALAVGVAALAMPGHCAAGVYAFGALRAPMVVPAYPPGGFYAPPAYYPPALPYYGYPFYAVPAVPYGYPLGYRGAWRTDYPWWSPGPRGYRWH